MFQMIDTIWFLFPFKLPTYEKCKAVSFIAHLDWKITEDIISEDIDALKRDADGLSLKAWSWPVI